MNISEAIKYVGVNDHNVDLFEGQYVVPNGMSYNSYVILDDKIAVMDSVDANFGDEWIGNIKAVLAGRKPDYLVVHHMEMDHSANVMKFAETFPDAKIVSSKLAFVIMKNLFGTDFAERQVVISEGSKLELGKHTLSFIAAPQVHWPEVVFSFEEKEGVLFSADAFGKFGALDVEEEWACEARRYYFGIVGKFGSEVQSVLKKVLNYPVKTICPLHGPVLFENLGTYIKLYDTWSSYKSETEGIFIAYTSVYGNTKKAAELLAEELKKAGTKKVVISDLARSDWAECVEDAFRYDTLVLATTTYCLDIFPKMKEFIEHLVERKFQNKKIAIIENGSWNITCGRQIVQMFEKSNNICFAENKVTLKSALNETSVEQIKNLAMELK